MFSKLDELEKRYDKLSADMSNPDIIANQAEWNKLAKEFSGIEELTLKYREYKEKTKAIEETRLMLSESLDRELRTMVQEELEELEHALDALTLEIKRMLIPKDPSDDKNVVVEVRAGAGGEEAALFASELYRMYVRFAERNRWKTEILSSNFTDIGGVKEIVFVLEGKGAYSRLKYESGVHRVQRVPKTESGGRIHTSTSTVAVLPEAEEVEVEINPSELRIDVFRSSGNGGQSVNTTDSAVRVTHLPTGMVVSCQDEKSQLKNKEKAIRVLRARLLDVMQTQKQKEYAQERKSQIGTGDRSERIRTYNFPQGRISDHRITMTMHNLENFLDGEISEMLDALIAADQDESLKDQAN